MKKILLILSSLLLFGCTKDEILQITLEGNPTTGYEWTYEIENEEVLIIDSTNYEVNSDEVMGSPGFYMYDFKPVGKGETKIIFSYKRSFEETEPLYKITYRVKVDDNNKIEVVSSEGNYSSDIPKPIIK